MLSSLSLKKKFIILIIDFINQINYIILIKKNKVKVIIFFI